MRKLFGVIFSAAVLSFAGSYADAQCDYSGDTCCEQEEGVYVSGDVLIWKAVRTDLDYAVKGNSAAGGAIMKKASVHSMDFDWDFGFRVALGYRLPCDRWDVRLEYTRFHTDAKGSLVDNDYENTGAAANDPAIWATRLHPSTGAAAVPLMRKVSAKFNGKYDVLDLVVSHPFCPCPSFEVKPYGGVRGVFFEETMNISYDGDAAPIFTPGNNGGLRYKAEFKGFGLNGGFNWYYHLCGDFSLYGKLGACIVVGDQDAYQVQVEDPTVTTPVEVVLHEDGLSQVVCGTDAALGLNWERCCGDTIVNFTFGYEMQQWVNLPQQRRFFDTTAVGQDALSSDSHGATLGFHGAFFRGRVDF